MYGYFSSSAAEAYGSLIYPTPTGGEVEVTHLAVEVQPLDAMRETYGCEDLEPQGEVMGVARQGQEGRTPKLKA